MAEVKAQGLAELAKQLGISEDMVRLAVAQSDRDAAVACKAEAEKLQKEAAELSGARQQLSIDIMKAIKDLVTSSPQSYQPQTEFDTRVEKAMPTIALQLANVKAAGFQYKPDTTDTQGVIVKRHVALTIPGVKGAGAKRSVGAGEPKGKSVEQYGLSLGQIFEAHATAEDKAKLAAATSNSAQWQAKNAVKKRALAKGLLTIKS